MPSTYQSIVINASIDDVWQRIKNFHEFNWASEIITSCETVGSIGPTDVGAKRILNGVFHETLIRIEPENHLLEYSIDDGPSPVSINDVSNYVGSLQLRPVTLGEAAFVEWYSQWGAQQEDAIEFCHGIYVALLQILTASLE